MIGFWHVIQKNPKGLGRRVMSRCRTKKKTAKRGPGSAEKADEKEIGSCSAGGNRRNGRSKMEGTVEEASPRRIVVVFTCQRPRKIGFNLQWEIRDKEGQDLRQKSAEDQKKAAVPEETESTAETILSGKAGKTGEDGRSGIFLCRQEE